ncbi:tryptophan synthase, alpha chain [Georgenia satyanarayanai]|uniref:Tryptophan synthase alpha chain n=1 Tax=Georgenia satyanarayanai TaxID=860221 RepID=A0A2Y9A3U4_9MICO|nr:tryptophan synthase subunit alpha [Georgenia satyanarayanai]PYG02329.1 tryptophan synthase alpha chain [Georgenia satyanarayanai]SSA37199.1 tryptophan synthase, alpha chain [Georgenia satyanarayanai]
MDQQTTTSRRGSGAAIDAALAEGRKGLVIYLPVGFPTVERSVAAARTAVAAGADVVELGLPYSDPGMDGEVIQHATTQALAQGTRITDVLRAVEEVAETGAAVLVMTYYNPVLRYGVERFARDLASAGGAGLITPDLIPDEAGHWVAAADEHDLDKVFLVAPSSTDERLAMTAEASRGFVYAASTMGVTGVRSAVDTHARELVARTRSAGAQRVCVGLGVSTGEQAAEVAEYADGVIVGSALVRTLQEPDEKAALSALGTLVEDLATGVRR